MFCIGKCSLEIKDAHGQTPLARAVYHDHEDVAEALLIAGMFSFVLFAFGGLDGVIMSSSAIF